MTDDMRGIGGPSGPPWSVDVLADLHAGALEPELSATLWPQVNADPQARAVIEALDTVKVELGQLGSAPAESMPANVAARLDAALEAEARRTVSGSAPQAPGVAPVVDLGEARRRRNRRMTWGAGLLTAAAAAVAVTVAFFPSNTTEGDPVAGATPTQEPSGQAPPLALKSDSLALAVGEVGGERDYGPLETQERLDQCIEANGIDPDKADTIGVRPVTLDGKPGVAALLTTGVAGKFRILIVESSCGPGDPGTMANTELPGGR